MIDLRKATKGKEKREPRVLIYGDDGVGKTSFAAGAPDPFFIDMNKGSFAYDVHRVIPETWQEILEWVEAVEKGTIKCQTLVLDSLSDTENIGNAEFFPGTTIEKYEGGFGKGDGYALAKWRELLSAIERVWLMDKTIILIGHAQVKTFTDPTGPSYDRFQLAMRDKLAGQVRRWSDFVLFAREEVSQQKVGNETKAVTNGNRWVHTRRTPAFDAKSRGTTLFPERILLSWDEFSKARAADAERAEALRQEINTMLVAIGDKKLDEMVKEYLRANPGMIVEARNRVAARFEEKTVASKEAK